jgi:transcriptional regulator with XRE-family HTH domain
MFIHNIKIKDVKTEIGQLIKSFRKRDNISQQELAEKLHLSRITIQNLESGKNFTIDTLLKVLEHFELLNSLNELLKEKRADNENLESLY